MEKIKLFKLSYGIIEILVNKKKFINERNLKLLLNKDLNEFKRLNGIKNLDIKNDIIDYYFDDCIRLILKYSLVDYRFVDGERQLKINNIGKYIYYKLEEGIEE